MDSAAVGCERGAQPGRHVAAVKGSVTRGNASEIAERFARGHEGWGMAQVGVLAGAWNEPQDTACAVRTNMELGAQAATAAPEALRFRVAARGAGSSAVRPCANAARFAEHTVLSSSASPSAGAPGRNASNTRSHQPRTDQRRKQW